MPAPFAFLVARLCRLPSTPDNTIKLWNMASGRELGAVPTENLVWPHSSSRADVICYATSSYVVHFKCALNFGEPQAFCRRSLVWDSSTRAKPKFCEVGIVQNHANR